MDKARCVRGANRSSHTEGVDALTQETRDYWMRLGIDVSAEHSHLSARITEACHSWHLEIVAGPLPGGLTSLVYQVRRDGTDYALKATPQMLHALGRDESVALGLWAGDGAVRLAGGSLDGCLRLCEWLDPPGAVTEDEVTAVLRKLQARPAAAAALPVLAERVRQMFDWAARMTQDYVAPDVLCRCGHDALALAETTPVQMIVHGDLQPKNLMRRDRSLVVIDPIPAVGDGAFDLALWSLTAPGYEDAPRRAARMAEVLGHDPARAVAWTRSLAAVVAAWPQDEMRRAVCAQMCA